MRTPPILPLLCFLASLGTLWVAAPTSQAADVIYSYVDDEGVPHFTDQWQLIPEKYRSRIQQLDPSTGKPVSQATGTALQDRSAQRPAVAQNRTAPTPTGERPFYADWLDAFSRLKIPALSSGQLTIGLTAVALFGLLVKVSRRIKNPFVKLAL